MGNDANRATVRAAFRAWQDGTGAITSLFAPDMAWRTEGHSAASKEYRNRQELIGEVLAVRSPVRRRQAPARPRPSRDLSSYPPRY
jgi:uncharacterized protein